jgi:hypothetical protein
MTNAQENRGWAALMIPAILITLPAAMAALAQDGVAFTRLHSFDGTDGSGVYGGLVHVQRPSVRIRISDDRSCGSLGQWARPRTALRISGAY